MDGHIEFLRNGTCHNVNVGIGHSKGSSNVANRSSCGKSIERNDLGNVIRTVFISNVAYDLLAPYLTNINIKIGHGYTLGI